MNMEKILCNECYQPLTIHKYDLGIYVDVCSCQKEKEETIEERHEKEIQDTYDEAYFEGAESRDYDITEADSEGYNRGYEEGFEEGKKEGYDEGYDARE
jgi:flagellar biosynthesis/type III secretory pathway protein FliH